MDILYHNFLRRFLYDVVPLLDWAVAHWAITLVLLVLALIWASRNRRKRIF